MNTAAASMPGNAPPALERALLELPDPQQLRAYHDRLASAPHLAGSAGDR